MSINITLRQMRAFIAVAEAGSFTHAADRIHLAQSTLTSSVRELEAELGLTLFDRTTRRVVLTAEGAAFLPTVTRLMQDFDTGIQDVMEVAAIKRGHVRIAAGMTIISTMLAPAIGIFNARFPAVKFSIREDNGAGVSRRVKSAEADFGISGVYEDDAELVFKPLVKDCFGMVCRHDHLLARKRGPISWSELDGHQYIRSARDSSVHAMIANVAGHLPFFNDPAFEASNLAGTESLLAEGLGFAILTAIGATHNPGNNFVFRPLVRPKAFREICLITRRNRSLSPAANAMTEIFEASVRTTHLPTGAVLVASPRQDRLKSGRKQ
jgi:LysR family transcriptional regulator, carnitine catabolism transcriptional activator